jgi:hypothetical protein
VKRSPSCTGAMPASRDPSTGSGPSLSGTVFHVKHMIENRRRPARHASPCGDKPLRGDVSRETQGSSLPSVACSCAAGPFDRLRDPVPFDHAASPSGHRDPVPLDHGASRSGHRAPVPLEHGASRSGHRDTVPPGSRGQPPLVTGPPGSPGSSPSGAQVPVPSKAPSQFLWNEGARPLQVTEAVEERLSTQRTTSCFT